MISAFDRGRRRNAPPLFSSAAILLLLAVTQQLASARDSVPPVEEAAVPSAGLRVVEGEVLLQGKPWRGIGVNYYDLFARRIDASPDDPAVDSWKSGLQWLAANSIPFVRFSAGGFYPANWNLRRDDPDEWFARMDGIVREAERLGIGLIPSLFWMYSTVPDLAGESIDHLGDPESRSMEFIRDYTRRVVTRYRGSPAIWGWELGNEYNLAVDLPNAAEHRPPVVPAYGTPSSRTERDELGSAAMVTVVTEFAREVRRHDPARMIISGHAIPRASAWHNTSERSWTPDTPEQFAEILARDNPAPVDTVSIHVYGHEGERFAAGADSAPGVIRAASRHARELGRPLVLGEFGVRASGDTEADRRDLSALLEAVREAGVPVSAFWVYDFKHQAGEWNTTPDNDRAWMLEMIGEANRRFAAEGYQ